MFLVIDTNVLFSFFRESKVFELVRGLRGIGVRLISPDVILFELLKLKEEIMKSSKISEVEFEVLLVTLTTIITSVPKEEYEEFLEESKRVSPHLKDAPLFALSLAFDKAHIWSREQRLKRQKVVKVLHDKEVEEYLGLTEP